MGINVWRGPLKIVVVYVVIGTLWILMSDFVEVRLTSMFPGIHWLQTAKGIFYVVATGVLLFYLIHSYSKRQLLFCQLLHDKNRLLQSILESQGGLNVLVVDKALNIAIDLGNDNLFGHDGGQRCSFLNLNELKAFLPWFDALQQAIVSTWRNGNYRTLIETQSDVFKLDAMIVKTQSSGEPMVLVVFSKAKEGIC